MPYVITGNGRREFVSGQFFTSDDERRYTFDPELRHSPVHADRLVRIQAEVMMEHERERERERVAQTGRTRAAQELAHTQGRPNYQSYALGQQSFGLLEMTDRVGRMAADALNSVAPDLTPPESAPEIKEPKGMKLVNTFKIGCDPEFVVFDPQGGTLNLTRITSNNGKIGWDHSGECGELRPSPCKSAWSLTKGLQTLILDARLQVENIGKLRGGGYVPLVGAGRTAIGIGGHIHLDLDPLVPQSKRRGIEGGGEFDPEDLEPYSFSNYTIDHGYRMKALDQFTDRLEQLDILPKKESEQRRATTNYGRFGSFRVQTNPTRYDQESGLPLNSSRTEYRTMASWLFSPKATMVCLTGAKLAAAYPKDSIEFLGRERGSFEKLYHFFEVFAPKDEDATRVIGWLDKGIKTIQDNVDGDFRARWKGLV